MPRTPSFLSSSGLSSLLSFWMDLAGLRSLLARVDVKTENFMDRVQAVYL